LKVVKVVRIHSPPLRLFIRIHQKIIIDATLGVENDTDGGWREETVMRERRRQLTAVSRKADC